jgi:4-hydroxy-2-oxoheptanedioate aldolase
MDSLQKILSKLRELGCSGIKVSFEDEGALYNEIITMRNLTNLAGVDLSVKIGGCEAKRDIIDCMDLNCDSIVAPMIESEFALKKFLKSLNTYNYNKKKGFNLETIEAFNNLDKLSDNFNKLDFVTIGRVDFVGSLQKDRSYVDTDDMLEKVKKVFRIAREKGTMCYLGGAITINSKNFLEDLINNNLLDKFETRYIIYDVHEINIQELDKLLYWGNVFEVEWLKFIHNRYLIHANKDVERIKMIEERISKNNIKI